MFEKSERKVSVTRNGAVIVIRMKGGPDCLWLNMYLDALEKQMTCDSDIGFYAYHWGKNASMNQGFVQFCINWLADDNWLLRKCIGERRIGKCFDYEKTSQALVKAYKEETMDEDESDCNTYFIEEALSSAAQFDDPDVFAAVLQSEADSLGVDLPEEWWVCIERDYTPWQKRFAEICREVIVPELLRFTGQEG